MSHQGSGQPPPARGHPPPSMQTSTPGCLTIRRRGSSGCGSCTRSGQGASLAMRWAWARRSRWEYLKLEWLGQMFITWQGLRAAAG